MKFLKLGTKTCAPCKAVDSFFMYNAPHIEKVSITSLDEVKDEGVLYVGDVDDTPALGAHFQLGGIPAIVPLDEDNNVVGEIIYKPDHKDFAFILENM